MRRLIILTCGDKKYENEIDVDSGKLILGTTGSKCVPRYFKTKQVLWKKDQSKGDETEVRNNKGIKALTMNSVIDTVEFFETE